MVVFEHQPVRINYPVSDGRITARAWARNSRRTAQQAGSDEFDNDIPVQVAPSESRGSRRAYMGAAFRRARGRII